MIFKTIVHLVGFFIHCCYLHMAFSSWICHKCWQRHQPLHPDWFHSKIIDTLQGHFIYVQCSGMKAALWLLATANTLMNHVAVFTSHQSGQWRECDFFFNQCFFNQRFRNASNKLYNVRVLKKTVNRALCVTMHWTCSDMHYSCTDILRVTLLICKHSLYSSILTIFYHIWLKISLYNRATSFCLSYFYKLNTIV
jgi:hypothetical protein